MRSSRKFSVTSGSDTVKACPHEARGTIIALPDAERGMKSLVECIPNISEGRRGEVVAAIRDAALGAARDVLLLDSTSDPDHNRSVFTFLGEGPALVDAMTAMVGAAIDRIDLRSHKGAHPRIGAVDVI